MNNFPIKILLIIFSNLLLFSCRQDAQQESPPAHYHDDPHSFARPSEAVVRHLDLELKVDFGEKILSGFARYRIHNNGAEQIVFDARGLAIKRVTAGQPEKEAAFNLSAPVPHLGSALTIDIDPSVEIVTIYYSTTPEGAAALDWLDPEQTADKKHPFLFTQGQAILARTWIPCQDSPGIRITYNARIEAPKELMAVMSASNPQRKNSSGVYNFTMAQPVPPYLIALAVGDLQFKAVGERTGVYAEPSMVDKAAFEFADMEKMLLAAEEIYGPYLWDRYDVIVLPPSFPFGGMENPRLTFATPTVIAGDRSLTSLIAHELAHSWSGNLVTNATWNDFWLNEGFTVYFERRIMERLYGVNYTNMLALLGFQDLEAVVEDLWTSGDSLGACLKLNLEGRDPDDGMNDVAYEKGALFLTLLEEKTGRKNFDDFLRQYFERHKFQAVTTEEFLAYLEEHLISKYGLDVNIDEWVYKPGIPANVPKAGSNKFDLVDAQVERLDAGADPPSLDTRGWTTHEWLHFIRRLPKDLDESVMKSLDDTFGFSDSGNSEILNVWFELAIRNGYSDRILPKIETFLVEVGRRKFLTPLYRSFKETGQLETARDIYRKARPNYHSISRKTMEDLLELKL